MLYGLARPQGCLLYGWREPLTQEIPTFHVERCSVIVHVLTQRVILFPQEIHKIAKTAAYRITHRVTYQLVTLMTITSKGEHTIFVSNVIDTFIQFDSLGFTIHPDKSVFIPPQRLVLLGFIIDSVAMTISLTHEKTLKVKEACGTLLGQGLPTI